MLRHLHEVPSVIEHLSTGGLEQSHEVLHEHCLTTAATPDDKVGLTILEGGVDVLQHLLVLKRLI